ncbi:MAG: 3'(2'),5'-bisphosphate nucleotidase CysQ [Gemmatimonadota bacterium]
MTRPPEVPLDLALKAALAAGGEIMDAYGGDVAADPKQDGSPLTLADRRAHRVIEATLEVSGLPVLSEEGVHVPYRERRQWSRLWIVDPLDGTKEFLRRNGEFTVNIAMVESGYPVLGVVYAPALGIVYYATRHGGAWKESRPGDDRQALPLTRGLKGGPLRVVASRSHLSRETEAFIREHEDRVGPVSTVSMGSSLKICLVAEGSADCYPRFAPTMEWDTAAGQAIVEAAGGSLTDYRAGVRMRYNRENLTNEWFLVCRGEGGPSAGE